MDGWNTTFLLGWPIFRGEPLVSGRVFLRGVGSPAMKHTRSQSCVFSLDSCRARSGIQWDLPDSNKFIFIHMWVFPKIGVLPNHPFVHRVFHYFHHPFSGNYPYFWVQHPCITWCKFLRKPNSLTNNKNTNELLNSCESKVPPPRPY